MMPSCKRISFRPSKRFGIAGKKLHLISYKDLRKLIRREVNKLLKQNNSKNAKGKEKCLDTNNPNEKSYDKKFRLDYDDIREITRTEIERILNQVFLPKDEPPETRCPAQIIVEDMQLMIHQPREYFHANQIDRLKSAISSKNQLCDNYLQTLHQSVTSIRKELNSVTERLESIECVINKDDEIDSDGLLENIMESWSECHSDSNESNETQASNADRSTNDDKKSMPDLVKILGKYESPEPKVSRNNSAYESPYEYEIYFGRNKKTDYDYYKNLTPLCYKNSEKHSIKDNNNITNDLGTINAKEGKERKLKLTHQKLLANENLEIKEETRCPQCCLFRCPQ